jgi:hypothetical protein
MRGRSHILLPLAILLFAACDPAFDMKLDILNESGHAVVLLPPGDTNVINYNPWYSNREGLRIEADSSMEIHLCGGIGLASRSEAEWRICNIIVPDSAVFLFDDGRRLIYHADDTLTDGSPYNFESTHYKYSEKVHTGYMFHGEPYFGRFVYTLTQEQYEQSN